VQRQFGAADPNLAQPAAAALSESRRLQSRSARYLIWTYSIRRMAERQGFGGLMAIGKSRAKVYVETDTKVTFRDVAGVKYELQERPV
jgi:hypothetical protein